MIIQIGFYRRHPDLTIEEFRHLWSEVYGPLYNRHGELRRHLRRYVQHRLSPVPGATYGKLPYDGFSEAWFDRAEAAEALLKEPIYLEQVAPLASSFLDLNRSQLVTYDSPIYQVGAPPLLDGE